MFRIRKSLLLFALCGVAWVTVAGVACAGHKNPRANPCGVSPGDWCPAPPGDPCGSHHDTASCKADPACEGMPYRGESVVACIFDERGFASNCPTVGCQSRVKR